MDCEALNVVNWNACSIKSKQIEFGDFLRTKNIDIALLSETHLKPLRDTIYLPGYTVHRLDRTATVAALRLLLSMGPTINFSRTCIWT